MQNDSKKNKKKYLKIETAKKRLEIDKMENDSISSDDHSQFEHCRSAHLVSLPNQEVDFANLAGGDGGFPL